MVDLSSSPVAAAAFGDCFNALLSSSWPVKALVLSSAILPVTSVVYRYPRLHAQPADRRFGLLNVAYVRAPCLCNMLHPLATTHRWLER